MTERRVGLIPSVDMMAEGNQTYAVLVTDRRMIFVSESLPGSTGFKDFMNGMFREDQMGGTREAIDFQSTPIDALAAMAGSKSVLVSSIRKLELGSLLGNHDMTLVYDGEDGKAAGVAVGLNPPWELVKANKVQGIPAKETKRRYALKCQDLIKRVVPPMVSSEARWLE